MKPVLLMMLCVGLLMPCAFADEPGNFLQGFGQGVGQALIEQFFKESSKSGSANSYDPVLDMNLQMGFPAEVEDRLTGKWELKGEDGAILTLVFTKEVDSTKPAIDGVPAYKHKCQAFRNAAELFPPTPYGIESRLTDEPQDNKIGPYPRNYSVFVRLYDAKAHTVDDWRILKFDSDGIDLAVREDATHAKLLHFAQFGQRPRERSLLSPNSDSGAR